jgi:hypothetical protein
MKNVQMEPVRASAEKGGGEKGPVKCGWVRIDTGHYCLEYDSVRPWHVSLMFVNGVGAELFVASGCDRDELIDQVVEMGRPVVDRGDDRLLLRFTARTTLWESVEYEFECLEDRVLYGYRVVGKGALDDVRFFEGFRADDPRREDAFYPFYCGPGRHRSYHRPVKEFLCSSRPEFRRLYSFGVNSADKRTFYYHENASIRANGDRFYLGGDWLFTPAPFLFLMGNRSGEAWVTMGLVVPAGENNYLAYEYRGGEGFGLRLDYQGYTKVEGQWHSPKILFAASGDVYAGLEEYSSWLRQKGCVATPDRSETPGWWRRPIFGGWGEQVYLSHRWENYFKAKYDDWHNDDTTVHGTQAEYEKMLSRLEALDLDPGILIVDNRWYRLDHQLEVDRAMWPDMEGFIRRQHSRGRRVILWVSPWGYCGSGAGSDVPLPEQMIFDKDQSFDLEIDTDVFYDACLREARKTRIPPPLPEMTLAEPVWHHLADPLDARYEKRLRRLVRHLLSPEGLNADGFEFDYTHFLPKYRNIRRNNGEAVRQWGVELSHSLLRIYYDEAKKAKPDALMITQTFNPYFNDVSDMLRLQDIYTDRKSIVAQMEHRAKIGRVVCPGCRIHTDQHPMPSLKAWREYAAFQPKIGNPCLYYVSGIETTKERLKEEDFRFLGAIWKQYEEKMCGNKMLEW